MIHSNHSPLWRTLLTLGRVSNLPTVWSNCLAGWLLGGGGRHEKFWWLALGATLLYTGGMFLNDACDAEFDAQHRRERPIPSGAIALKTVWQSGLGLLGAGAGILIFQGITTGILSVILLVSIILYDAIHKMITFSPVLMAACRFLLYLMAASVGLNGVTGWAIWGGLALAAYVIGLSYLARNESTRSAFRYWPCCLLATPVLLALLMNAGESQEAALLLSAILGLWIIRSLRFTFWNSERNIGRTVSGLLAGIALVDLLALADSTREQSLVFFLLFIAALLFQRFVPAT
jgi:4-hydroxybenzoate polyprenyltransferase